MASTTKSGRASSISVAAFSLSIYCTRRCILASGLMSWKRSAKRSAFGLPRVERRAISWRLRLLGATVSASMSVSSPTPLRASISAA